MGVDCKELKALKKKLENEVNAMDLFIQDCSKELAARLLAKVIKRTPVGDYSDTYELEDDGENKFLVTSDKMGGTLRRGWTSKTAKEAESGSGSPTAADAKAFVETLNITHNGGMYTVKVTNPVEYSSHVEYGHTQTPGRYVAAIGKRLINSWVEGQFFLTISEQELQREAPRIIEAKIAKELGEYFK